MLLTVPDLLTPDQARECRDALLQGTWSDGRATAGHMAARAKQNRQLDDGPLAERIGNRILEALGRSPRFMAAALPLKVLPPRFNRYGSGGTYANHVDNAVFSVPGTPHRIRSDLSATLFLTDPDDYDGGELVIEDTYGAHRVKLPAGHLVLYPGTSLHHVTPVTRGERISSFFWVQSLVRHDARRGVLWELDGAIQDLARELPEHPALERLGGVYHNLLREWAET